MSLELSKHQITAHASATEVCVLPCQQMSGAKARYFYSDNYKDEDDDEQLQNMINGIVSIHIH